MPILDFDMAMAVTYQQRNGFHGSQPYLVRDLLLRYFRLYPRISKQVWRLSHTSSFARIAKWVRCVPWEESVHLSKYSLLHTTERCQPHLIQYILATITRAWHHREIICHGFCQQRPHEAKPLGALINSHRMRACGRFSSVINILRYTTTVGYTDQQGEGLA